MQVLLVELGKVKEASFSTRKTYDRVKLDELIVSVKERGVLEPIIVRPNNGSYELVCGARRLKAAAGAGLEKIPAIVRELDDKQALEVQIVENLQREDVHPLEEAEGYEQLLKKHGYKTVGDIAVKVGKSTTYVYGRLKLCELLPENRKLFREGKLSPSVAMMLARVPAHLQKKAGQEIVRGEDEFPVHLDRARRCIQNEFMLQLKEAQFDPKEKGLAGKVACAECPKRTGNQPELFADVQDKDTCTDPACYDAKKGAHALRTVENLRKQGLKVVSDTEAKKLFPYEHSSSPEYGSGYLADDHHSYDWPSGLTVDKMLKVAKDVKPVYAVHPKTGRIVRMVEKKDLGALLKASGIKARSDGSKAPNLAAQKKSNRVELTRQVFWREKLAGMKDRRCLNVVLLYIALQEMGYGDAEEFVKGLIKDGEWDVKKLYALGDEKVKALLDKAAVQRMQQLDVEDADLDFLCETIGFTIAKDYIITKEYLEACTKDELVKLAKEIGLVKALEKKKIDCSSMGTMKKGELIDVILKSELKASVPKELVK